MISFWPMSMRVASPAPGHLASPTARLGLAGKTGNYLRTTALLATMTALVVLAADYLGGTGWAIGALVFMGVMNFATWFWSDKLVVAMHGARPLTRDQAPVVHDVLARLTQRAGAPMPRLMLVRDAAPNAFATGRNPRHAVVAVTTGLLETLDEQEVEGVLAHELSHVLNRDMLIGTIAATMAGAISLLARLAGWALMFGGGRHSDDDNGPNPIGALLLMILAPIIAVLLQLAVSRSREYGADATGARLAGNPHGLASALAKLDAYSRRVPMRTADPATAHLYIVAPLAGRGAKLMNLFQTHPPIAERIRRIQEIR
jgi:heat shock protein HtpX